MDNKNKASETVRKDSIVELGVNCNTGRGKRIYRPLPLCLTPPLPSSIPTTDRNYCGPEQSHAMGALL
jgi:hypothetical protein